MDKDEFQELPESALPPPNKATKKEKDKDKQQEASPSPAKEKEAEEKEQEKEEEEKEEEKEEVEAVVEAREAEAEAVELEEASAAAAAAAKEEEASEDEEEEEGETDAFSPDDPKAPIKRLVAERLYGQAFEAALDLSDVAVVEWLAGEVAPAEALADGSQDPLSQPVLVALLQQLGSDLSGGVSCSSAADEDLLQSTKLAWVREAAMELDPEALGQVLTPHVRPILAGLVSELKKVAAGGKHADAARGAVHVVNSVLHQCS